MHEIPHEKEVHEDVAPAISVILPVCHTVHSLRETVESVIKQDFDAWEMLIICGQGISDDNAGMAEHYAESDKRIRVVKDSQPSGFTDSLNRGIKYAKGEYIALIAAGDVSDSRRLSTQFAYMEERPVVGITQFYQRYIGDGKDDFICRPPVSAGTMKAKLLFFCDVCFSTVMIRKSVMERHGISFDPDMHFPEHVFWFKMVQVTDFETIPKIYGASRIGSDPFPVQDDSAAQAEMCEMAARLIFEKLELEIPPEKWYMLGGRENAFFNMSAEEREKRLPELSHLMFVLWRENLVPRYFFGPGLVTAISKKWRWAKYNEPWYGEKKLPHIGEALELSDHPPQGNILSRYLIRKFQPKVEEYRLRRDLEETQALADMLRGE